MFKEMHKVRNMYLARLHERLARDLMRQRMTDDSDRWAGLGKIIRGALAYCADAGVVLVLCPGVVLCLALVVLF